MAAMTWEQQQQLRQLGVAQGLNPQQLQQAGQQMLTPQPQTPMAFPRQQVRPQSAYQPWAQQEARRQPLIPPKPAARPQPAYQPPPKGGPQGNAQYLGGPMARPPLIPPKPAAQPKYGQPPTYDPAAAPKRPTAAKPPAQTPSGNQAGQGQPVRAIPPGQPVNVVAPGKERRNQEQISNMPAKGHGFAGYDSEGNPKFQFSTPPLGGASARMKFGTTEAQRQEIA